MLSPQSYPVPRKINFCFVLYFISTFTATTTVFCGPGTISSVCHLSMLEDTIQNKNNSTIINRRDSISARKMNTTNNNNSSAIINDKIGGGSVNEKERRYSPDAHHHQHPSPSSSSTDSDNNDHIEVESSYNPLQHRSHLLHAIEGLNRYPNYLSRWKENDVEALEQEL